MAKKKYKVLSPLNHDGKEYRLGDSIELDIPEDHSLLGDGVIADGKAVRASKEKSETEAEAAAGDLATSDTAAAGDQTANEGEGA